MPYKIYSTDEGIETFKGFIENGKSREFTGGAETYDLRSYQQFDFLMLHGLRENHKVLDIGCGDLVLGRLLIPFLNKGCYFGIEPERWLIQQGFETHLGYDIIRVKKPTISPRDDFKLTTFNTKFNYIMAYSIFSHATKSQIDYCFNEATKVLDKDGLFFFTYVPSYLLDDEEMRTKDCDQGGWAYPGINTYIPETIKGLAEKNNMKYKEFDGLSVNKQKWCVVANAV